MTIFEPYLTRWKLIEDGPPVITPSSNLLAVLYKGQPAMLKITKVEEEKRGGQLMRWWQAEGAARVYAYEGNGFLLERVTGNHSLTQMASNGSDDQATQIMCKTAAILHAPVNTAPPPLVPLCIWFKSLLQTAPQYGGLFRLSADTAQELLDQPRDITVLHGDIHHGNVLDGGSRGWLAIDPKGLLGERGFDFANLFCNPTLQIALTPGRLTRQVQVVCETTGLEKLRLLKWILAWAGLSATWMIEDDKDATLELAIARLAATELAKS